MSELRYRTIVADPPWQIQRRMGSGGRRAHATEVPYDLMTFGAIEALDVESVAANDCALFLWTRENRLGWDTWGNEALEHVEIRS